MKERPILFKGAMVRAILSGHKTQTRRVVKPQPQISEHGYLAGEWLGKPFLSCGEPLLLPTLEDMPLECPYGQVGDLLYVRETFCYVHPDEWHGHVATCPSAEKWPGHPEDWEMGSRNFGIAFAADGDGESQLIGENVRWRPSIHMPKWASRLWLRVVDVQVERLQDISSEDALAEGIRPIADRKYTSGDDAADNSSRFQWLWNRINTERGYSWESNPFVWVVEFERVER